MNNQEKNMLENLQKIMINIRILLKNYDYNKRCGLLYDFLTKDEEHTYDTFIENIEEINEYKTMIILNLCTDFYVESNYRIKKNKPFFNSEKDALEMLENRHTPDKIISFFKNERNRFEAEIIIENYFDLMRKDEFYLKKCINCAINTNKVFRIMVMNPLANLRYFNFEIPKSEIIREEIYEIYKKLMNDQTKEIYEKKCKTVNQSNFIEELNCDETTNLLYNKLKGVITNPSSQSFLDEPYQTISYIISSAYESMKLSSNVKYQNIINYIENKEHNETINFFVNNDDFSNIILSEFIKNCNLNNPKVIIEHRKMLEELGATKILKEYNQYYDIETEEYNKRLTKSISETDTQHKVN